MIELQCPLTPREKKVLFLLATGMIIGDIANALKISISTVKNHIYIARTKLEAPSALRAVVIALQHGWIDFPEETELEK